LLTGMVPIKDLVAPPDTSLVGFYRDTGGLRRRLRLLARAAEILTRLHAVPVAYGDVSDANVFVSAGAEDEEVWLIDAANLRFVSSPGAAVHTARFGSPEVVREESGNTTLSDAYAFALLAFLVLAQQHPFHGDYVEQGGWADDVDREAQANRGELPWIDDPADR